MIALFAAVSFSMSQSLRGSGAAITKDKARLGATEIVDYLQQVRSAVKILTINGCDLLDINFQNSANKKGNDTTIDPAPAGAEDTCSVFNNAGGGVIAQNFKEYASAQAPAPTPTQWYPGHFGTRYVDASRGSSENDLAHYATGIDMQVCLAALSLASGGKETELETAAYTTGGVNSFTPGGAGTLTPVAPLQDGMVYVVKLNSANNYCHIGIILDVQ